MDFGFSEDQEQLRGAVADYFARELPISFARAMLESPEGFTQDAWHALCDLGWLALAVPDELGGSGLGLVDLAWLKDNDKALSQEGADILQKFVAAAPDTNPLKQGAVEYLNILKTQNIVPVKAPVKKRS